MLTKCLLQFASGGPDPERIVVVDLPKVDCKISIVTKIVVGYLAYPS